MTRPRQKPDGATVGYGREAGIANRAFCGPNQAMVRIALLPILVLAACATSSTTDVLSVRDVVERARSLNGQEVLVSGWLQSCQTFSCGLYGSQSEVVRSAPYYLSIGPSRWFDSFASRAGPRQVVIRGRVHDLCISDPANDVIAACSDRPASLEPLAVIP